MSVLVVEHLRKSFDGRVAVDDVSFSVAAGEVFGLLGPNGAGKSTTMSMIAGLVEPDSGNVTVTAGDGVPVDRRLLLGVVPQDLAIYPDLTVRENLTFFGSLYRVTRDDLRRRVDSALDRVGLADRQTSMTRTLSGGMKRRLNFAAALLHEPKLLILDEPTVGVDPQSRAHLMDCVRDLAQSGMAVIYASHYMEEVQAICRTAAILDHGKMLANDSIDGLLARVGSRVEIVLQRRAPEIASQLNGHARYVDDQAAPRLLLQEQSQKGSAGIAVQLAKTLELLVTLGVPVRSVETQSANLERLFLDLTGRGLRD
ncbi:MAG: ABC transporter ATP-binding protein [Planctomycetaceae bacterium]